MSELDQKQAEEKEARIAQLEARLNKIEEMEKSAAANSAGHATFPALTTEKQKLMEESVKIYGELSPFYHEMNKQ